MNLNNRTMKEGEIIGTFTIVKIIEGIGYSWDERGNKKRFKTHYALLKNSKNQERVLRVDKSKISESEMYYSTFKKRFVYKDWSLA